MLSSIAAQDEWKVWCSNNKSREWSARHARALEECLAFVPDGLMMIGVAQAAEARA